MAKILEPDSNAHGNYTVAATLVAASGAIISDVAKLPTDFGMVHVQLPALAGTPTISVKQKAPTVGSTFAVIPYDIDAQSYPVASAGGKLLTFLCMSGAEIRVSGTNSHPNTYVVQGRK